MNWNQCSWEMELLQRLKEKRKVILKLTSGKDLVLSNVLHVPNITKNLISGPILSNKEFKLVIESDKIAITKGGMYVGNGYLDEGLFKLSVVTDDNVINNNNAGTSTASMYMIDPSFLWHYRLGHVNFRSLQRMINLGMLPKCSWFTNPTYEDISNNTIIESAEADFFENIFPYKDKEKQISSSKELKFMFDQLSEDETDNVLSSSRKC
ncbi:pol polyprotein [Tanacetum coccineum]|uniref:Pol polyprotein n=1 Tax=Tanacetum coccineum TaxID=301880 RepID=A0ABQ5E0R8_9ASTR